MKCAYCEQCFPKLINEQYRESAELNILKYSIIPICGVFTDALHGKRYIECPHCKLKVPQG